MSLNEFIIFILELLGFCKRKPNVKKILPLLLLIPILFGCEDYEQPSEVNLTGGTWIFTDYKIVKVSSISPITIIPNDTICINSFGDQSYVSGGILMKQNYGYTPPDRRFIKGVTTWEFDMSSSYLYCNNDLVNYFTVNYPAYMRSEHTQMEVTNPRSGSVTQYTFFTDALGANYPRKLTLTSPEIVSDLFLSDGMRDKAVTVKIILIFTR